jgi:hypothetical protein
MPPSTIKKQCKMHANFHLIWLRNINVRPTARHDIHFQFDISANVKLRRNKDIEIRAIQSSECIVWCTVDCTDKYEWNNLLTKDVFSLSTSTRLSQELQQPPLNNNTQCVSISECISYYRLIKKLLITCVLYKSHTTIGPWIDSFVFWVTDNNTKPANRSTN